MSELKCMSEGHSECSGEIKKRSFLDQIEPVLCEKHHEELSAVKLPRDPFEWHKAEEEDYQFYLDNVNKLLASKEYQFDVLSILEDGEMPVFKNDIGKTMCAQQMAEFIKKHKLDFTKHKEYATNILKLMDALGDVHAVLLGRLVPLHALEKLTDIKWEEINDE